MRARSRFLVMVTLVAAWSLSSTTPAHAQDVGSQQRAAGAAWVRDDVGALSADQRAQLAAQSDALFARTGARLAVSLVADTGGQSIEQAGVDTFRAWGLGDVGGGRAVLLMVAVRSRRNRIVVGNALRDALSDAATAAILSDVFRPRARAEGVPAAVLATASAISDRVVAAATPLVAPAPPPVVPPPLPSELQGPSQPLPQPDPTPASLQRDDSGSVACGLCGGGAVAAMLAALVAMWLRRGSSGARHGASFGAGGHGHATHPTTGGARGFAHGHHDEGAAHALSAVAHASSWDAHSGYVETHGASSSDCASSDCASSDCASSDCASSDCASSDCASSDCSSSSDCGGSSGDW